MSARRIGLGPILAPLFFIALTLLLGIWQVERLGWKQRLLARIDAAAAAAPVPLGPGDAVPSQFARVIATGRLDPAHAAAYASDVRDLRGVPTFGVFLLEPLLRSGGPPVLVDLGWVPAGTDGHPSVRLDGAHTITGYVRRPERGLLFTPSPDLATRQFYALDPATIARGLGLDAVAPFTLVALARVGTGPFPDPVTALPRPPNNHLQYAVTWFTLAGIVAVWSGAWWFGALRRGGPA